MGVVLENQAARAARQAGGIVLEFAVWNVEVDWRADTDTLLPDMLQSR